VRTSSRGVLLPILLVAAPSLAADPQDALTIQVAVGTTDLSTWTDTPPAGSTVFYRVTAPPVWKRDVTSAPVDPQSSSIIANLAAAGGFGNGRFQIGFSITVLTAADDRFTVAKWDNVLPSGSTGLAAIHVTDFEVIDAGIRTPLTYDCVRNP